MNWQQFQAYVWLRWRIMANQWRRGGAVNAVLMSIITVGLLVMSIPIFLGCLVAGWFLFPDAKPTSLLYVWDGITVAFLVCWGIGILAEMQQAESLAVSKFLHLPVSVGGAFVINYLSSLLCLTMVMFLPVLLGLSIALALTRGIAAIVVLPLTLAFLLMVTALSNQFQSWLSVLMSNPRRRRAVVVGATAVVILIAQVPNLINLIRPWGTRQNERSQAHSKELTELTQRWKDNAISAEEFTRQSQLAVEKNNEARLRIAQETADFWEHQTRTANMVLPIGWLPLGVMAAAEGRAMPAVLGTLALTTIGLFSLRRAYRTTMRHYQGQFTAQPRQMVRKTVPATSSLEGNRIQARLPGVSEPVTAIALASGWSLVRSPEAKMMLMMPLVMAAVFASIIFKAPQDVPDMARPLLGIGAFAVVMFGTQQLMANQFGFDRNGFRVFVLCAAARRDILMGKNLSFVPLLFGIAIPMLFGLQFFCPMHWTHLLSMAPQYVSMFLLFCILMNFMSIYTPFPLAAGSIKPAKPKFTVVLLQFVLFCSLFPLLQLPTLLPLGIEALLDSFEWTAGLPICLMLTIVECAGVVWLYRKVLIWQGQLLQNGEQRILEVVTGRAA